MPIHRVIVAALVVVFIAQSTSLLAQTDTALRDELVALVDSSESGYMRMQEASRQHGHRSLQVQTLLEEQSRMDAGNLARLREILSEHGWPGQSMVGDDGAAAAFMILQHADHQTQVEFLPLMKTAVEAGELERRYFALLQDQILVAKRRPQIFGTKLYWDDAMGRLEPFPIEDEANVDARRQEIGMMPLAEYVELMRGGN